MHLFKRKSVIYTLFFLLLAQKKETKKKAAKNKCFAVFGRPTHMNSAGRNTAPPEVSQNTKPTLRLYITMIK